MFQTINYSKKWENIAFYTNKKLPISYKLKILVCVKFLDICYKIWNADYAAFRIDKTGI